MADKKSKDEPQDLTDPNRDDPSLPASATEDAEEQVQSVVDEETKQGFRGTKVDPTPNENYTVAGVAKGAPTPETDENAAREADTNHLRVASRFGYTDPAGER